MKYLVDTNIILMFACNDERLELHHKNAIMFPENEVYISVASFWEMGIKYSISKLDIYAL